MKGRADQECKHKKCWEFKNYPEFNSITRADIILQHPDFTHFRKYKKGKGGFILPVNPYPLGSPDRSAFKNFESKSFLDTFGTWPNDRNIFSRLEVSIEFVQYAAFKYIQNPLTGGKEKVWSIDVKEAAVYGSQI